MVIIIINSVQEAYLSELMAPDRASGQAWVGWLKSDRDMVPVQEQGRQWSEEGGEQSDSVGPKWCVSWRRFPSVVSTCPHFSPEHGSSLSVGAFSFMTSATFAAVVTSDAATRPCLARSSLNRPGLEPIEALRQLAT